MDLFFAYGSLLKETGYPDVDKAMAEAGADLGRGYIHAQLFDLGEYPGALPYLHDPVVTPMPSGDQTNPKVWGRLIALRDPECFFAILDEYEGFRSSAPESSEFIRGTATVFLTSNVQVRMCHVYFYNQNVNDKQLIPSGDYLALR